MSKRAEGRARGRPKQSSEISLASCRRLDRHSPVPLYYQLAATLYEHLEIGNWKEGTRFATERELEDEFKISRSVVRRALALLVADGAIERSKGKGAFIAPRRSQIPVFGLIDAIVNGREDVSIEVISVREDPPDPAIVKFLSLDDSETIIARVVLLLRVQGRPVGLIDSHAPTSRVPWLLDAARSLMAGSRINQPNGVSLTRSEVLVEHTSFSSWSAPILGAEAGDPAFMSRLIQYGRGPRDQTEHALEFARLVYPCDRTEIILALRD